MSELIRWQDKDLSEYYNADDVDAVIAEKDNKIAELKHVCSSFSLYLIVFGRLLKGSLLFSNVGENPLSLRPSLRHWCSSVTISSVTLRHSIVTIVSASEDSSNDGSAFGLE